MIPTWPVILTDDSWQKKKGNIAKLAGETGIGATLTEAHEAFKLIKWHELEEKAKHVNAMRPGDTTAVIHAEVDLTRDYRVAVERTTLRLVNAEKLSAEFAKKWKANKLIPSSAVKAVTEIGQQATILRKLIVEGQAWLDIKKLMGGHNNS